MDASFALKLVLPEDDRDRVRDLWVGWLRDGVTLIAPWLLAFETQAVLWRKVTRGELTDSEGLEAWRILRRQGIHTVHPRSLFDRAWAIARLLSRPTTYDAIYLATAELHGCELWTADHRLINAASHRFAWMRTV